MKLSKSQSTVPTSLITLAILYTVFFVLCYLFSRKELYYPFHALSAAGMLVAPVALMLMDVIVEVFGYRIGKQVFWASLFSQAVFCFVAVGLAYLPDSNPIPGGIAPAAYHAVLGDLPRIFLSCFLAILIGVWVNARLLAKWKFLLKGRYFWLRSIGASAIGDGIFVVLGSFFSNIGHFPLLPMLKVLGTNYIIELVSIIILSPFATFLMGALMRSTQSFRDRNPSVEFNPFQEIKK